MAPAADLSFPGALAMAVRTAARAIRDAAAHARGWFLATSALFLVQTGIPATEVWLLKRLIESLSAPNRDPVSVATALAPLVLVVGLAFPLSQIAMSGTQRLGFRLVAHYHATLAHAAARLRPSELADPDITAELQGAERAIDRLARVAGNALQLAATAITAVVLCAAIARFDPLAGVLVLGALVPSLVAFTVIARVEAAGWPPVATEQRRAAYATEQLVQQRSGTELAVLGTGAKVADVVATHQRRSMSALDGLVAAGMRWEFAAGIGTAVFLAAALVVMITGGVSAALAAAAIAGILSGLSAVRYTGFAFGNIVATAPHAEIYRSMITRTEERSTDPTVVAGRAGQLRLQKITATYPGASAPAIEDVTLRVGRGEIIALVGANGAGKTTTVNALLGIVEPDSGAVLIDDQDAAAIPERHRLDQIGLLTQEFGRYEFTVRDVVGLGTPEVDLDDAVLWSALDQARAADLVRDLPDGLDTQLGQQWGGVGLSAGQWQRLALARICLRDAGIWILDEPTSAIDAEAEREIFAELQESRADRITIVVSHRAWTLRGMDRIYVFDRGRITQTGSYDDLLAVPGRFRDLFAEQLQHHEP